MTAYAEEITGNVSLTYRYYGISRQCFYTWRRRYDAHGLDGLRDRSHRPQISPNATRTEVVGKIITCASTTTRCPWPSRWPPRWPGAWTAAAETSWCSAAPVAATASPVAPAPSCRSGTTGASTGWRWPGPSCPGWTRMAPMTCATPSRPGWRWSRPGPGVIDELMGHQAGRRGEREGSMIGTRYRHMTEAMQARVVAVIAERLAVALAAMPRCAQARIRGGGDVLRRDTTRPLTCCYVVVELRGFEPLTPCMPYTARPHDRCCSRALALVIVRSRLTARYRCCPSLSPASCRKYAPGPSGL
jgi:leucine-zipper of insertion element IS481